MMPIELSVVVPCYRSHSTIRQLCGELLTALPRISEHFEILLVNDGSPGKLLDVLLTEVQPLDPRIYIVDLTRNFGQQSAVLAGFEIARGDYIVTIDDDLQHNPEDICILHNAIVGRGDDVVVGRLANKAHSLIRNIGTRTVKLISNRALGVPFRLDLTSFRIVRRQTAKNALLYRNVNPIVGYLLFMATDRMSNATVRHRRRKNGQSTYSLNRLKNLFTSMLINYSDLLLVYTGRIGNAVSLLSVLLAFYYFISWMIGRTAVSGFTTVVLLQLFFFGLLFSMLGVLGMYLSRIIKGTSNYPLYLIRNVHAPPEYRERHTPADTQVCSNGAYATDLAPRASEQLQEPTKTDS